MARYTKVGRIVTINAYIAYPTTADVTAMNISGLPFSCFSFGNLAVDTNQGATTSIQIATGATTFKFTNNVGTTPTNAACSGKFFIFSGSYTV
jgi:hypothetical protein